jgi:hypothetical protein
MGAFFVPAVNRQLLAVSFWACHRLRCTRRCQAVRSALHFAAILHAEVGKEWLNSE